jgi:hypothetical protein
MANLSDLVATLAHVTAVPEAKVFAYGRFAREAGLIAQKGRGRGAAMMCSTDAANLLIALGGTSVTREAAYAIRTYRPMRGVVLGYSHEVGDIIFLTWLETFGLEVHPDKLGYDFSLNGDFGSFLEFLIREAGLGNLMRLLRKIPAAARIAKGLVDPTPKDKVEIGWDVQLQIIFYRTKPFVTVEFKRKAETVFQIFFAPKKLIAQRDMYVSATVSQETLTALGLVLADKIKPKELKSGASPTEICEQQAGLNPESTLLGESEP